jgi:BirA family biotin operon repressor/biotin-[acetyl-CoA-carboxylase] ligase
VSAYDLKKLRTGLGAMRLLYRPVLRSTQTHAMDLRRAGRLVAPCVVLAGQQTAGRGRGENQWYSSDGTMTATFVLPVDGQLEAHRLPLLAGLAVRRAAAMFSRQAVELKWPNDLVVGQKKLAGLLCERIDGVDLIGVGLNVMTDLRGAPPEVRARAVSLTELAPAGMSMTTVLLMVSREIMGLLHAAEISPAAMVQEYDRHHALVGRTVTVDTSPAGTPEPGGMVSGVCEGLDGMGRLVLVQGDVRHRVISGQVVAW